MAPFVYYLPLQGPFIYYVPLHGLLFSMRLYRASHLLCAASSVSYLPCASVGVIDRFRIDHNLTIFFLFCFT